MKIESIIRRPNGTEVVLGRRKYVFRPEDGDFLYSPHVCDVTDSGHISAFLGIPEGYRVFSEAALDEDGEPIIPVVTAPAPSTGRTMAPLSPIEIFDLEDQELDGDAEADRLAAAEEMRLGAVEAAEAMARLNNDGAETIPGPDGGEPEPDLVEADGEAPVEDPAEGGDDDGAITQEKLEAMDDDELAEFYTVSIGKAPKATMKKPSIIKAILAAAA